MNTLTRTGEKIQDMAQVELQAMPYVVTGLHSCDCGQHENSVITATMSDLHS